MITVEHKDVIDLTSALETRQHYEKMLLAFGPRPRTQRAAQICEPIEDALSRVEYFIETARAMNVDQGQIVIRIGK